jgi:hypothetical protein
MADFRFLHDCDEGGAVHRTGGEHRAALGSDIHFAHDVATGRNHPGVKVLALWIEAYDRVRPGAEFAVADDIFGGDDAVRLESLTP